MDQELDELEAEFRELVQEAQATTDKYDEYKSAT